MTLVSSQFSVSVMNSLPTRIQSANALVPVRYHPTSATAFIGSHIDYTNISSLSLGTDSPGRATGSGAVA